MRVIIAAFIAGGLLTLVSLSARRPEPQHATAAQAWSMLQHSDRVAWDACYGIGGCL